MTYRLHNRLGSGGFVIEAALAAAGIEFAYDPLASLPNSPVGPQVHSINPWGQVPILELPDGTHMTEVAAILAHLSYAEPALRDGPALWIDDHPRFLKWSVFLSVNVYEAVLRRSYTARYFASPESPKSAESPENPGTSANTESKTNPSTPDTTTITAAIRQAASDRMHAAFHCIEAQTSGHAYLLSDKLSACDIYLALLYAWFNQKPDLPKCTWITTQVATHPTIRPIWQRNFHDRLDFKWHEL